VLVWLGLLGPVALVAAGDPPSNEQLQQWIGQLGDPDYSVRERAHEQLAAAGFDAFEALSDATEHEDLEVAARAKYLLRLIQVEWSREDDPETVKAILGDYEALTPEERLTRIRQLAWHPGDGGLAAACRLIRYEQAQLLSKLASLELLNRMQADPAVFERWARRLPSALGSGSRPGVQWLRTYSQFREAPKEAVAALSALVEAEQITLKRSPEQSSPRIVALLLYHLAALEKKQGETDAAEKTARRARDVNPGRTPLALLVRVETAATLKRIGLGAWAAEEFRHVIKTGVDDFIPLAYLNLAEMYHDEGQNLKAAEMLAELLKRNETKAQNAGFLGRSPNELRARMAYFQACHHQRQGDQAAYRRSLEEALRHQPTEADTLIAYYHLPEKSPEQSLRIRDLVAKTTAAMRKEIESDPEDANAYNQFAWIVGNTEGDRDEAMRYAHKAVEKNPDSGAYFDTLAHVYAGKGDWENAVKYQARAVELEPHSGLIVGKFKVFQAKRKEQQTAGER
jgi:tetratricopeptide (TPR) repeat protein